MLTILKVSHFATEYELRRLQIRQHYQPQTHFQYNTRHKITEFPQNRLITYTEMSPSPSLNASSLKAVLAVGSVGIICYRLQRLIYQHNLETGKWVISDTGTVDYHNEVGETTLNLKTQSLC